MKVALAQINTVVGDVWGNVEKATDALRRAMDEGADLVAFPELTMTGYPPEDLLLRPSFIRDNLDALEEFAGRVPEGIAAAIGFVDLNGDLYNSCAVASGGKVLHRYHKRYLPNYGVFDENRYFREGAGAPILKLGDALVGLSICEDIWYPGGPAREQALGGAGVLLNVSASPYHRLKGQSRERMLSVRASDYGCYVIFCNLAGGQDELVFDGRSAVFDPEGHIIARAKQFEEDLLLVDIHPEEALVHRLHDPRPRKENSDREPEIIEIPGAEPETSAALAGKAGNNNRDGRVGAGLRVEAALSEEGEVFEALVLGLGDYFRKNGFSRAVLGLSGGIDSALGAVVAAWALGPENVTGVLMPSQYTSEASNADAYALVENLGMDSRVVPIGPAFDAYKEMLSEAFEGLQEDETEENIQSRIRGNILMALSNKFGWIVLSTGNKSEASVGYSTLYGDTAGGFSVIRDVPKTLVYRVCRYVNETKGREVIPDSILTKEPSAELREDQRDTDSLPPYDVLDPILEAYVEEDKGIGEIIAAGFDEEDVKRAISLVDRAEYKRRQVPTGIKVTARSFGRDRRMPITNRYRERREE
ncbi:MAG: NAD synthetase / Glutamine amidotransferase chain of NAD synthetase [uncultured Rubrobacteraceae bacterium]|uniref:Glutamine-dependent NAD(+) synthetase n=1 Tax=uncultured Rubrobacteraceae bacterium TaxID=349277 RepID=A0A6J4QT67_9ACTN|nr:MAG: NAD synthetase / Glutamine amidotransferase chain of NAD synthetase [uncultured Rubrobacteraceae bacterium]